MNVSSTNDGTVELDVRAGEWWMPRNARDGDGRLGPGIPKSDFWASATEGFDQVGCVYTERRAARTYLAAEAAATYEE